MPTVNKESPLTLLPIILMVYGLGMLTGAFTQKHHDAHDKNDCITYVRSAPDSFKTTAVKIDARCVVFPTETLYDCTSISVHLTPFGGGQEQFICNLEPQHATTSKDCTSVRTGPASGYSDCNEQRYPFPLKPAPKSKPKHHTVLVPKFLDGFKLKEYGQPERVCHAGKPAEYVGDHLACCFANGKDNSGGAGCWDFREPIVYQNLSTPEPKQ